ncbi:AbrB/MazE/SpoVT family DNA-binding domain-containing protein [Metaclostridioides mangenotii]|uniref:AbrB/MazE/SpoVT family DNA-binding domain-containing protein n=1 Tax=Metaclostridioides mangenotii TaxID=1540 RepID=UPI0028F0BD92|nr:AbrB/MazE/SpoVT family DNA-binding domain-containing protein [Clostridioides mangenotii]
MKNSRILKVLFSKSGSGSTTTKITLPITWIKEMGINEDSREVEVTFEDNKITIQKKSLD